MTDDWSDPTAWVYLLTLMISIYGTGLFFWWWASKGGASSVFMYVTFIFLGETIDTSVSMYSRYLLHSCGSARHILFMDSPAWPLRVVVTLAALTFIVVHMTWRVYRTLRKGEKIREAD